MPSDKRERQRANREAKLAEQQKQDRRAGLRRSVIRWTVIAAIVLTGLWLFSLRGGEDDNGDEAAETTLATTTTTLSTEDLPELGPSDYAGFRDQPTACGGDQPDEITPLSFEAPEDMGLSGTVSATLTTSCGDIEFALDADTYPETVNSFVFLADQGYFDGTVCHRLVPDFVLQCGDATATGAGDAGYDIPDEFPADDFTYEQGAVAMANAGPGTTGSQFFIVIGDASALGPQFSVLGTVVGSEETLTALLDIPLGISGSGEVSAPLETLYLETVSAGS
jgi:peptidyl-prolyl cis-trans isomerase B (cyclophilin B)